MSSRKTFVEVFDLLLILHPLVLGTSGFRSEGTSSATPRDSSGSCTWMESWVVDLRRIAALAGGEISLCRLVAASGGPVRCLGMG